MTTAYFAPEMCAQHEMGPGHPEQPLRQRAVDDGVLMAHLNTRLQTRANEPVLHEQIYRAHAESYVEGLFKHSPAEGVYQIDGDTSMNPVSLAAAMMAAGACVAATDLVLEGEVDRAFCNVRPPGHHAERARAMGFCFFNSVAIAALHALDHHGLDRVAIVDFDVHHGNGTEDILRGDRRVLFCSTYEHPLYPFVNNPSVDQHLINVPLPGGTGSDGFRQAFDTRVLRQLERFQPQMMFFSAGFDAHEADPLASLQLVDDDFRWATESVMQIAATCAGGRAVSTLEGGYDLPALGRSAAAHVAALLD